MESLHSKDSDGSIAIFLASLRGGGAERAMLTLAKSFAGWGLPVDLILVSAEGPYLSEVPDKVRVVDLQAKRVILAVPALIRYLRKERPAVLLTAMIYVNVAALITSFLAGSRVRVVICEQVNQSKVIQSSKAFAVKLLPLLVRLFYRRADRIVTVSEGIKDDLLKRTALPENKVRVIYNPVVTAELHAAAAQAPGHPWFADNAEPVVLGAGRLNEQKDFGTLIRAFARLREERALRLIIIGEGEERGHLEALIRSLDLTDWVSLPGFVANPYAFMSRSSLFVLSSTYEGFGNVLGEAMACGCPVVSTDCPSGPAEILEGGRYGPLVPVGDVEALARAMKAVLDHPPERQFLQDRAGFFSAESSSRQYLEVLLPRSGASP